MHVESPQTHGLHILNFFFQKFFSQNTVPCPEWRTSVFASGILKKQGRYLFFLIFWVQHAIASLLFIISPWYDKSTVCFYDLGVYFMKILEGHIKKEENIGIQICNSPRSPSHGHAFLEMVYIMEKSGESWVDGNKTIVHPGDYLLVDYGSTHAYAALEGNTFPIYNCLFEPEFIDRSLAGCKHLQQLLNHYLIRFRDEMLHGNPARHVFHDEDGQIGRILNKMKNEFDKKKPGYLEILRANLIEILILTMRQISLMDANRQYERYAAYVQKYVREQYMHKITLGDAAKELHVSLPYLSMVFSRETGCSFSSYVQKIRIEQSCRLLANTRDKIIDIALAVGYSDVKFFYTVFKRQVKMSPLQFRKTIRRENILP
ncbi:MAG TPA: hypothetical protein DER23_04550 [Clostridiales bacterium]|nr:hypothetical protein [Clostridiales bacterium]